jgi:hypothetical protein
MHKKVKRLLNYLNLDRKHCVKKIRLCVKQHTPYYITY